jgi:predicted nucleotidyltransferase
MSDNSATATGCAEIVEARLPALRALCRRLHVRRLDLFGSAATGRFDPSRSDLDFLVEFEELLPGGYANAYFGLLEALEGLFGRPIDLLTEPGLKNPYLRKQVLRESRMVFPSP